MNAEKIREELFTLSEEKYQKFSSSLIPGITNLIGVRIPEIRKIAKKIAKEDPLGYLLVAEDTYFEEIMLQGLVIGAMKSDIETVLFQVEQFVPKIDNWSVCDSFSNSLKIAKKHREEVWKFLIPYWHSEKEYEVRFAVVMMLFHFVTEEYLERLFEAFNEIKVPAYYVKMAVAWAVSVCFVKFPEVTMQFLKQNELDDETFNKSIQKIRESRQVSQEKKKAVSMLKRQLVID